MHKLLYKKLLHGLKNLVEVGKNGRRLVLNVGCRFKIKTLIKTRFASNIIMFEKTLEFKQVIITCYGRQKNIVLQQRVPKAQVWAITEAKLFLP
jgi:hypothetical protein